MPDLHESFLKAKEQEKEKDHDRSLARQTKWRCLACHYFECRCGDGLAGKDAWWETEASGV